MPETNLNAVTGAFGFTGRFIAGLLLDKGMKVKTLTNHPDRPDPFGGKVEAVPFNFDNPSAMVKSLAGVHTVFNTYWVRFNYGRTTFGQAICNVQNLIRASAEAGVKRFVHVSITNPDEHSPSGYFRGKAMMERTLIESGLSYAIVRPTVLFGDEGILVNNIAWLLRRFPFFSIPGTGEYRIQPVFALDVAELAVKLASRNGNIITDAVGPETYSFAELVYAIRKAIKSECRITRLPPGLTHVLSSLINPFVRDVVITKSEIDKLMLDRLVSYGPPTCATRFSKWLSEHASGLGKSYFSELKKHYQ